MGDYGYGGGVSSGYGAPCHSSGYGFSARHGLPGLPARLIPAGAIPAGPIPVGPFNAFRARTGLPAVGPFNAFRARTGPFPAAFSNRDGCHYSNAAVLVRRRGKRDAEQEEEKVELNINEVFNTVFGDIHKSQTEGCFQRLVCDIAARPDDFQQNSPILTGVDMMETDSLSSEASAVSRILKDAAQFGRNATDVKQCEMVYNDCHWSGPTMDKVISNFDNKVTLEA